ALAPSDASAMTVMSGSFAIMAAMPVRTTGRSSAVRTLIVMSVRRRRHGLAGNASNGEFLRWAAGAWSRGRLPGDRHDRDASPFARGCRLRGRFDRWL